MTEALELYEIEGKNSTADVIEILDYLSYSTAQVKFTLFKFISWIKKLIKIYLNSKET